MLVFGAILGGICPSFITTFCNDYGDSVSWNIPSGMYVLFRSEGMSVIMFYGKEQPFDLHSR